MDIEEVRKTAASVPPYKPSDVNLFVGFPRVCINSCGLQEIRELPPSSDKPVRGGSISPIPRAHKKPHFVSEKRDEELYEMTRLHLSRLISNEISGDEQLIKEVWEQAESDDEREAVKETLRGVLHFLDDGED